MREIIPAEKIREEQLKYLNEDLDKLYSIFDSIREHIKHSKERSLRIAYQRERVADLLRKNGFTVSVHKEEYRSSGGYDYDLYHVVSWHTVNSQHEDGQANMILHEQIAIHQNYKESADKIVSVIRKHIESSTETYIEWPDIDDEVKKILVDEYGFVINDSRGVLTIFW